MRGFSTVALCGLFASCAPEHSVLGRAYDLQVPVRVEPQTPLPMLILAHGYTVNGVAQDLFFPFSKQVDEKGFVYVLPNGTADRLGKRFWSATDFCCNFENIAVDDVAFFKALIADVKRQHPIKPGHVFIAAHSNGAFMALRLACEASDVIDGIVAVSGSTWNDEGKCPDGRKIPILLVHGTEDAVILYDGAEGKYPGARATGQRFARRSGCTENWIELERADFVGDASLETKRERIEGCEPAIELWSLEGTAHLPYFDNRWTGAAFDWLEAHAP
jgi:polyhydroxybutyrate depolymerase